MSNISLYNRQAAVDYAHKWAYGRNPRYYDYEDLGGDCTNFTSQCIFAGSGIMNWTPTFGWYYAGANRKSPSWTGVPYLWNFLTRGKETVGPVGKPCLLEELQRGDIIQLNFDGYKYSHSPFVVAVGKPVTPQSVLIAAHSRDTDYQPLSSYIYKEARYLHITGVIIP